MNRPDKTKVHVYTVPKNDSQAYIKCTYKNINVDTFYVIERRLKQSIRKICIDSSTKHLNASRPTDANISPSDTAMRAINIILLR